MELPPFQRLVDAHWRDVARLAHALAGPHDGDDVAQQAWSQALAGYPALRSDRNLRGWLLTITHRCAMDVHRGRGRRAVPVEDLVAAADGAQLTAGARAAVLAGSVPGADPLPGTDLPPDRLWDAVRALPERQRTAVALRYVVDLDHAEIAELLGTSPAATRRLVSDALHTLRTKETLR